jgi:hypothetical protein
VVSLIDIILRHPERLLQVGINALADAKAAGTAIYYMDDEHGDAIIREYPDGRRELIGRNGGAATPIAPRRP